MLKNTQIPAQSVPPLDDRGGDTSLPPLLKTVWWLFLNSVNNAIAALNSALDAAVATIPLTMQRTTQSHLASGGPALAKGTLVEVTDYAHILRWTGAAYQWGPGEAGSGMMVAVAVAPTGAGWHSCDGTNVAYLKGDGTTGTVTLPTNANYFRQ